ELRPVPEHEPGGVPERVPVQRVPVHRAVLPVPEGAARLAECHSELGRRPLVAGPQADPGRLLAGEVRGLTGFGRAATARAWGICPLSLAVAARYHLPLPSPTLAL